MPNDGWTSARARACTRSGARDRSSWFPETCTVIWAYHRPFSYPDSSLPLGSREGDGYENGHRPNSFSARVSENSALPVHLMLKNHVLTRTIEEKSHSYWAASLRVFFPSSLFSRRLFLFLFIGGHLGLRTRGTLNFFYKYCGKTKWKIDKQYINDTVSRENLQDLWYCWISLAGLQEKSMTFAVSHYFCDIRSSGRGY